MCIDFRDVFLVYWCEMFFFPVNSWKRAMKMLAVEQLEQVFVFKTTTTTSHQHVVILQQEFHS